jgi:predicted DsbA family dithiol-disulfide isomerase
LASDVKVDIYSDVVCPWCAIGKARFESALSRFAERDEVEVRYRSFELDPSAPAFSERDLAAHLAEKYKMSIEKARESQRRLTELAAVDGLEFRFDRARRGNTFDAHRLLHFAHEVGLEAALKARLFDAYFTEGEAIADRETLVRLGSEVGLDALKSAEMLDSDRYAAEVRADEQMARDLGITGVPFFVIDDRYGISGAQSADFFLSALEAAWRERPVPRDEARGACEGEACELPGSAAS